MMVRVSVFLSLALFSASCRINQGPHRKLTINPYQDSIGQMLNSTYQQHIPGFAAAVLSKDSIYNEEGFEE